MDPETVITQVTREEAYANEHPENGECRKIACLFVVRRLWLMFLDVGDYALGRKLGDNKDVLRHFCITI